MTGDEVVRPRLEHGGIVGVAGELTAGVGSGTAMPRTPDGHGQRAQVRFDPGCVRGPEGIG
ncbi:hypothetical protein [Amycolatopsis sp. CA-128772]|uniref:hypothetical protein n=1 Tax=Amycolatopsis sp. CA-128772 TaxID=2073159 RepID=UPI000CD21A92|nr:hypothetical protein [Amycolatopsis sp. CA-128772]